MLPLRRASVVLRSSRVLRPRYFSDSPSVHRRASDNLSHDPLEDSDEGLSDDLFQSEENLKSNASLPSKVSPQSAVTEVQKQQRKAEKFAVRNQIFERHYDFVSGRLQGTVEGPTQVRTTALLHLIQMASTSEQLDRVLHLIPLISAHMSHMTTRKQHSPILGAPSQTVRPVPYTSAWYAEVISPAMVDSCIRLGVPEKLVNEVFGNFAKYKFPLDIHSARRIAWALGERGGFDSLAPLIPLLEVYSIPPPHRDLVLGILTVEHAYGQAFSNLDAISSSTIEALSKAFDSAHPSLGGDLVPEKSLLLRHLVTGSAPSIKRVVAKIEVAESEDKDALLANLLRSASLLKYGSEVYTSGLSQMLENDVAKMSWSLEQVEKMSQVERRERVWCRWGIKKIAKMRSILVPSAPKPCVLSLYAQAWGGLGSSSTKSAVLSLLTKEAPDHIREEVKLKNGGYSNHGMNGGVAAFLRKGDERKLGIRSWERTLFFDDAHAGAVSGTS